MDILDPDPLGPEIEVRTKDGLEFRHRFTLATPEDRVLATLACTGVLLLPAPSALLASLWPAELEGRERGPDGRHLRLEQEHLIGSGGLESPGVRAGWWPFDPLLSLGHAWLLGPNLVLNAVLMALTFRILHRRGASNWRVLFWVGAVFLTGALGLLVHCAFEPRRAWHRVELFEPEPTRIRAA